MRRNANREQNGTDRRPRVKEQDIQMDKNQLSIRGQIEQLLKIESGDKPIVYEQLFEITEITSMNYWLELILSAGIATLGLVLNGTAVVIGAMVVSPLMGPILASGL